jgi:hypothetical protein
LIIQNIISASFEETSYGQDNRLNKNAPPPLLSRKGREEGQVQVKLSEMRNNFQINA